MTAITDFRVRESGTHACIRVACVVVPVAGWQGRYLVLHRTIDEIKKCTCAWTCSEYRTGLWLEYGRTMYEAWERALARLDDVGVEYAERMVRQHIRELGAANPRLKGMK